MILPYALPAFLSALVWAGMMNQSFGFINQIAARRRRSLAGTIQRWPSSRAARQPLARLPVHVPRLHGRAAVDPRRADGGRHGRRREARGRVPPRSSCRCCWSSVAPLLIASSRSTSTTSTHLHAHRRRPAAGRARYRRRHRHPDHDGVQGGVHRAERDYGLASALSIIIFIIVAVISVISFRRHQVASRSELMAAKPPRRARARPARHRRGGALAMVGRWRHVVGVVVIVFSISRCFRCCPRRSIRVARSVGSNACSRRIELRELHRPVRRPSAVLARWFGNSISRGGHGRRAPCSSAPRRRTRSRACGSRAAGSALSRFVCRCSRRCSPSSRSSC